MQKVEQKPLTIVLSSFDWDDLARRKPGEIVRKLTRDKLYPEKNRFLILSWGPGRYEKDITPNIRVVGRHARFRFLRPLYDLLTFVQVPALIKRSGATPDLLLAYDFPMALMLSRAARYFKVPLVLCLTNLPQLYLRTRPQKLVTLPYLWLAERVAPHVMSAVYTINEACKKYAINLGIPENRVVIFVSDTIARERHLADAAQKGVLRERFTISPDKKVLLTVARLEHEKGLDRLIDALCELKRKDVMLVVAGKGSLRSELEQLALKRGVADRVIFAGAVPREEIWSFYKDADAFLLLSRAEALGLVFWEAMYAGLPVIGSRAVGIVETIGADEDRGFFWEPEDGIEALAERLQMCFDRDAAERRLKLARAYVEAKMSDTNSIYTLYQLCKKS